LKSRVLKYQVNTHFVSPQKQKDSHTFSREEMILRYAPFIKFIAQRLAMRLPAHVAIDDLISAGVIGLMDAVSKFDPKKKVDFKTYAEFRVRGAMLDELRALDWVPRSVRQKATQIERAIFELEKSRGRPVEDEEVARALGLSLEDYYETLSEINGIPLLDVESLPRKIPQVAEEDLLDFIIDEREKDPFDQFRLNELKSLLASAIGGLSPKEKLVISLYYYDELTLKEIGEVMDLTESRICQIHTKSILKLRAKLKRYLKDAL
jgi:RNA polymerase sigma factor FliA